MEGTEIKTRFERLKSNRKVVEEMWQDIERYVVPYRGDFFSDESSEGEMEWRRTEIYDSTAIQASRMLASSIQSSLTSPSVKWFGLRFRQNELNVKPAVVEWLEEVENRVFGSLQDSNFDLNASEFYSDLTSFGTAFMGQEVENEIDWEGFDFTAIPIREGYFEPDHKGQVKRFYRRLNWTAGQILSKFGDDTPDDIREKAESPQGIDSREEIIFCIYPRNVKADTSKVMSPEKRPFGRKYVRAKDGQTLGKEGGYYEMPIYVTRWSKSSGSIWGHSPAHYCLSDIKNLNKIKEANLEAVGKVVDPVMFVNHRAAAGNDYELGKGSVNVVNGRKDDMWFLDLPARFDVTAMNVEDIRMSVNRSFYVDQLQLKESPAMTATEVQARYQLMQRMMAPTLGRLVHDFLEPLISRTVNAMFRAGQLPEMPADVVAAGGIMDIEYTGPMPRAQKAEIANAISQYLIMTTEYSQVYPEFRDLLDVDLAAREIASLTGVPARLIRTDEELAEIREQRQQMEAMMMQQQMAAQEAATLKDVGRAEREFANANK